MKSNKALDYIKKETRWAKAVLTSWDIEDAIHSNINKRMKQFNLIRNLLRYKWLASGTFISLFLAVIIFVPVKPASFQIANAPYLQTGKIQQNAQFFSYEKVYKKTERNSLYADFMNHYKASLPKLLEKPKDSGLFFYRGKNNNIVQIIKKL